MQDNIENNDDIYRRIFIKSSSLMILMVQIYMIFLANGINPADFTFIKNDVLRSVLQFSVQIIGFAIINLIIYTCFSQLEKRKWLKNNKHKWLNGEWLHIHDKKNIRIGTVTIEQNYYDIKVKGINMAPNVAELSGYKRTSWKYLSTRLYPPSLTGIEFFGCYAAKKATGEINQGIHIFDDIISNQSGYPIKLIGNFSDTFKLIDEKVSNINDKMGALYFFKMTPKIKSYIYDETGINYSKLENIIYEKELADEEYVKELKKVINSYNYSTEKSTIANAASPH